MSETFDAAAWDLWRKSEVEKSGNDPAGWVAVSKNLVVSGALLASTYSTALAIILGNVRNGGLQADRPRTPEEEAIVRTGHQTHSVGLMLFGFAVECLLKATYLKRGGVLYRNGKYTNPKRLDRSHNLLDIADVLDCSSLFTQQQRDVLDLLSARNEMGRYPTHSRYDNYGIQPPAADGMARFYGIWDANKSASVFDVLQILYKELGEEIPSVADALLEDGRVVRASYGLVQKRTNES